MSLKVGTKGVPEARGAVACGVQNTHRVLVPLSLCIAEHVPRGPAGSGKLQLLDLCQKVHQEFWTM